MVIVKIIGGLGNQMFQYAFGRSIAVRNKVELKLDILGMQSYQYHLYTMDHLNIKKNYATQNEVGSFTKYRPRKGKVGLFLNPLFADTKKYVQEPTHYMFEPAMLEVKPPCYLDGYWQTEEYFKDIADDIHREFTLREPLSEYSQAIAGRISKAHNAVSLHIRRGDMAKHPYFSKTHGICPPEYYEAALKVIREKVPEPTFFIFSDDIEWARQNINTGFPTEFIGQGPDKNYEDLELMRLCRHHILSNSTFGWWGSWLSEHSMTGITVAPIRWTNKGFNTKDLLLPHWIKLPF